MEEVKNGVTVIDADTLLIKDDYCTFYLHRPIPSEMTWFDAMYWVNSKDWSLPDRWQGLTIARYRDEIVKHFGEPRDWWLWTCEEFESSYDGAWAGAYYVDIYYGNVGNYNKWNTAAVMAVSAFEKQKEQKPSTEETELNSIAFLEQMGYTCIPPKEQKPIIQDVELNDAVYDYVRNHFIAGADFTPEYIKKLMENAFFAGVDYYLLKQESESCEPDTNVEKVIENVILVYEKTQGGWVGGYDVDTLIVNLRRAFNKKEQKPAARENDFVSNPQTSVEILRHYLVWAGNSESEEDCPYTWRALADAIRDGIKALEEQQPAEWSEEDEEIREEVIGDLCALKDWIVKYDVNWLANPFLKSIDKRISWLKALHSDSYKNCNSRWKPSDEHPEGGYSEKPNDLLSEQEQPEVDIKKELHTYICSDEYMNTREDGSLLIARHFYELGKNARKEEKICKR